MRNMANLWKTASVAVASTLLLMATPAQAEVLNENPSAGAMVADAVVIRPLYFALSQVGTAVYTATLPFTLLGGNADQVAETLVVTPLQGAFIRCLGCGKIDNQVSDLTEAEGSKTIKHFVQLNGGVSALKLNGKTENPGNFGAHIGTNFSLVDGSRFDVMFGAQHLGKVESKGSFEDTLMSYQIANRFGRQLGDSSFDLMFKLGGHYFENKRDPVAGKNTSKSGFGFLAGVGVDAWATDNIRLGLEYNFYDVRKLPKGYRGYLSSANANLAVMF